MSGPSRCLAVLAVSTAVLGACKGNSRIEIDYTLGEGLIPSEIVRIETTVRVAPTDPRRFFADQAFRVVAPGIGYEVRDFDGTGERALLISHDSALGYEFSQSFIFTLLPPVGDAPPLMVEARAVGTTETLARTTQAPAAFAAGATVKLLLVSARCGTTPCDADQACCGGACTSTQTDATHCGSCDKDCGAQGNGCTGGICRCQGGSACDAGRTCCAGVGCVDTKSDPTNCGVCGKSCAAGETCQAGVCKCGSATCSATELCCADGTGPHCATTCACGGNQCDVTKPLCCTSNCRDPNDNNNCGGCDIKCGSGTSCKAMSCLCAGTAKCQGSDKCCASGCANTDNDQNNCGSCGNKCATGSACVAGKCTCGNTICSGSQICCAGQCDDGSSNTFHCGSCSNACNAGEACKLGACECQTPSGAVHCAGTTTCCQNRGCFDVSSDATHCGPTCVLCPPSQACYQGKCAPDACGGTCPGGTRCCNAKCTAIDGLNCPSCGVACTGASMCCTTLGAPFCTSAVNTCFVTTTFDFATASDLSATTN